MNRKAEKLSNKITKKRYSVLQICKAITTIAVIASLILSYYLINKLESQVKTAQSYITALEGRNEDCLARWKDLSERGKIIQTVELVEEVAE